MSFANFHSASAARISHQGSSQLEPSRPEPSRPEHFRREASAHTPSFLPSGSARLVFDGSPASHARPPFAPATTRPAPTLVQAPAKVHQDVSTRFGQRLRELRTQRNLTQVRMAREFGVDRSYISDLERGRKSVSLPTLEIFALGLRLSLAELLTGI